MKNRIGIKKLLFLTITIALLTVCLAMTISAADSLILTVNDCLATDEDDTVITWSSFTGEEENPPHTCVYDQYVVSEDYLKEGDVYYKSCTCGEASATDTFTGGTCGENLTWSLTADGELTIEGTGAMTDYIASSSTPRSPWSNYRSSIKTVTIGNNVTHIGSFAFSHCTVLTAINIPTSVTSIGLNPFSGCSSLTAITVNKENTSYHIDGNCLIDTTSKTLVVGFVNSTIPTNGSVISIGSYAFYGYTGLTSMTIPDSVTSIGSFAFSRCSDLTSITVPASITHIGTNPFSGCFSLATITVDQANTAYHVSGNCLIGTKSKILVTGFDDSVIPSDGSVTSIGNYAFYGCTGLTSATIPESVKSIGNYAFYNCTGLASMTILSTDATIYASTDTIPSTATIYGYTGSTAETYATNYSNKFVPLATDITSVFAFEAAYTPDAEKAGQYLPVATFTRTDAGTSSALAFLFAEGATGEVYVKSTDGTYLALYDGDGNAIALGSETTDVAVIYDDNSGIARYYVNGVIPYVGDEKALANCLPVHDPAFHAMVAVTDTLDTLDGVSVTNVYNINASGTADFVGVQVSTTDSSSIRLLAGLDMLYYSSVGFDVALYSNDILQGSVSATANTVFSGITANGETVTADSLGYRYLTALTINGIDRTEYPSDAEVYFIVKTYTMVGGVKQYGKEKKIVITHDASTLTHSYTVDDTYVAP